MKRKLIAMLLVLMMVAGLVTPALAAMPEGITPTNPNSGDKQIKMDRGNNNINMRDYIFVFWVYDSDTETVRPTTLIGAGEVNHVSGQSLQRYATFDDGKPGEWTIKDYIVIVDIYDTNWKLIQKVAPEGFSHKSGNNTIVEDGTTDSNGVIQTNGGTATFKFNGIQDPPPDTEARIEVEKIWVDEDGMEITALKNTNAVISILRPNGETTSFSGNELGAAFIAEVIAGTGTPELNHIFTETIPGWIINSGYTTEFVKILLNGDVVNDTDGIYMLDTLTLVPKSNNKVTFVNKLIPPSTPEGTAGFTKMKLVDDDDYVIAPGFKFSLWMYEDDTDDYTLQILSDETDGLFETALNGTIFVEKLDPGKYVFIEEETFGWELANYVDGLFFEIVDNGNGTSTTGYAQGDSDEYGPIVRNIPTLGSVEATAIIDQFYMARTDEEYYERSVDEYYERSVDEYYERSVDEYYERSVDEYYERSVDEYYERSVD